MTTKRYSIQRQEYSYMFRDGIHAGHIGQIVDLLLSGYPVDFPCMYREYAKGNLTIEGYRKDAEGWTTAIHERLRVTNPSKAPYFSYELFSPDNEKYVRVQIIEDFTSNAKASSLLKKTSERRV